MEPTGENRLEIFNDVTNLILNWFFTLLVLVFPLLQRLFIWRCYNIVQISTPIFQQRKKSGFLYVTCTRVLCISVVLQHCSVHYKEQFVQLALVSCGWKFSQRLHRSTQIKIIPMALMTCDEMKNQNWRCMYREIYCILNLVPFASAIIDIRLGIMYNCSNFHLQFGCIRVCVCVSVCLRAIWTIALHGIKLLLLRWN